MSSEEAAFWESIPLSQMSDEQWESLCDGCARCCLHKLQDEYSETVHYTAVACRLLDGDDCRCTRYPERQQLVADCVVLRPADAASFYWLPDTCAYRLLAEGRALPDWHPLVSGNPHSVHAAGVSVRGRVIPAQHVHEDDLEEFVITWVPPNQPPPNIAD